MDADTSSARRMPIRPTKSQKLLWSTIAAALLLVLVPLTAATAVLSLPRERIEGRDAWLAVLLAVAGAGVIASATLLRRWLRLRVKIREERKQAHSLISGW